MTRKYITALLICLSILTCNGGGKTPNSEVRKYAWNCFVKSVGEGTVLNMLDRSLPWFVYNPELRQQVMILAYAKQALMNVAQQERVPSIDQLSYEAQTKELAAKAPEVLKAINLHHNAREYMMHGREHPNIFNDSKSVKQATSKAVQELRHFLIGDSADTGKS